MSTRKRAKANKHLYKRNWKLSSGVFKRLMKWFLRSLLVIGRRTRLSTRSGFVLPTVVMVSLVVILLTTALLVRSFDRSKNASNVRVNQAVLNAATPALDRARAKIDEVFKDPTLPRETPSDGSLYNALASNKYVFGDETRLKLVNDIDGGGIKPDSQANTLEQREKLTTAWKFPVDTDNNGLFDSYTLYGIYFRSPTRGADGKFNRARNPLEARTAPMDQRAFSGQCADKLGTSDSVGDSDWYQSGNKLTKSFFVYTANVPITDINILNRNQYEQYKGNRGFSALELQQDRVRIPFNNNAVWYEDDIEVSNATTIRINGRVVTNSNLLVAGKDSINRTIFYQVSDPDSCYYEQENSKIIVGGNIANGDVQSTTDQGHVEVHRFQGKGKAPAGQDNTDQGISYRNKTIIPTGGRWVGYNNNAYSERIGLMVQAALNLHITRDKPYPTPTSVSQVVRYPQEVKERFTQRFNDHNETKDQLQILTEELETYFKARTRRVPYAEVPSSTGSVTALGNYTVGNVFGSIIDVIRPPDTWMEIEEPTSGITTGYTNLPLKFGSPLDVDSGTMYLQATEPTKQQKDGKEYRIGDRIVVGNNLPFFWPKHRNNGISTKIFDQYADQQEEQIVKNGSSPVYWTNRDNGKATNIQRTRQSQLQMLPDLGSVERDAFWEIAAAKRGLRVVTGAGIYFDEDPTTSGNTEERTTISFLPRLRSLAQGIPEPAKFKTATFTTNNDNIIVWPDSMPMRDNETPRGDLQMRATAVYHYKQGSVTTGSDEVDLNQVPIACVSSYYEPTNEQTARNQNNLPDVSGIYDRSIDRTDGQSNNGVTYIEPYKDDIGRISAVNTYRDKLNRQARAIFLNGRIVNEPLRNALKNIDARDENKPHSLADNAAIDTAICALKILDQTLSVQPNPDVPHGAIKEVAFLDSRQVKSLHNLGSDNTKIAETPADLTDDKYTLPLEQRQPLEIRATELDLDLLKNSREIGTPTNNINNAPNNDQEYLLPNSGIIYATRDDALPDLSDSSTDTKTQELVSLTDFKLDSNRRPNGIRLINGSNLARKNFYRVAEKGLILATNLPTYIKGDFNLHKDPNPSSSTLREEFQDELEESEWDDFYTRDNTPDLNFACRQYQPGCADSGDQWRPATIISDGQTLLSKNFVDGFRDQGDYDLNNNQGNSAVEARLKNGFWNNNFVTSANWADGNGYPLDKNKTSYLTNGVTPIQRRVDNFPEYVMEICRKLPVSRCGPKDWVIGYDADGNGTLSEEELNKQVGDILETSANPTNPTTPSPSPTPSPSGTPSPSASQPPINKPPAGALVSGTTATPAGVLTEATGTGRIPPAQPEDRRYARRIAFKRDSKDGTLELKDWKGEPTPIPIGINAVGKIDEFPYDTYGAKAPRSVNNSLWFRTTTNTSGKPYNDESYTNDKPLAYTSNTRLFSPPTPEIPGVASLNLPVENPASGYTICTIAGSSSKKYKVDRLEGRNCGAEPGNPLAAIQATLKDLLALDPNSSSTDIIVEPKQNGTFAAGTKTTFTNNPPTSTQAGYVVNVVDLGNVNQININEKQSTTIQLKGDGNSIFVFKKASGSLNFGSLSCGTNCSTRKGVVIELNGVDPNNVFWALNGNPLWNDVAPNNQHQMQGTFIINGNVTSLKNVDIEGRLLGVNSFPSDNTISAIASTGQPQLIPVLQIHSPTGTPGNSPFNGSLQNDWLQKATTTTANAAFITGDSPSRPNPSESGGGLYNLVRFIENWSGKTARISGSFIQYRRSAYSSAPFNPVDPTVTDSSASLFYTLNSSNQTRYKDSSDTGFRYRGGASEHRASFYMPPIPAYSFDVAILSQSPDFFAQKFTMNTTSNPTEYFREVGRDDSWVKTLLCAAQKTGNSYTYAVDSSELPSNCPSLTSYNDQ